MGSTELRTDVRRGRRLTPGRAVAVLAALSIGVGAVLASAAGADPTEHKVTLCHATDSRSNPYVAVVVDYHSVVSGGHGSHAGPVFSPGTGGTWGDVIPTFDFGPGANYPGMNLGAAGLALLANDCSVRVTTTSSTTSTTMAPSTTSTSTSTTTTTTTSGNL